MTLFSSKKEKRLWQYALMCWMVILSLLFLGNPLLELLSDQNLQAGFFVFGMILVIITVILHAFRQNSKKLSIILWLSLLTLFSMFLLRLGLPERSHLIEYSILAVLIHEALLERQKKVDPRWKTALMAMALTSALGIIDETLQLMVPDRFFDINDIFFNSFAAIFAVGSSFIVDFVRRKIAKHE